MMEVRLFDRITDDLYWKKVERWRREGKRLPVFLQDLGFRIVHKFIPTTPEDIRLEAKFREERDRMFNNKPYEILLRFSKEVNDYISRVRDFEYKEFHSPAPGYYDETMDWAKSHVYTFENPIKKGALLYYTYPIIGVTIFETLDDIATSVDLMEAFCKGYQTIYDVDSKVPTAFGVWGHGIKDLVMEDLEMFNDGQDITFSIGS